MRRMYVDQIEEDLSIFARMAEVKALHEMMMDGEQDYEKIYDYLPSGLIEPFRRWKKHAV